MKRTMGVSRDLDGHMKIITLPAGAKLAVTASTLQSGLVNAKWEDQTVGVFIQDLMTRGELIVTTTAA